MNENIFTASTIVEQTEEEIAEQANELQQEEIDHMAACDCEVIPEIYY